MKSSIQFIVNLTKALLGMKKKPIGSSYPLR
jgi:hypothetical protein